MQFQKAPKIARYLSIVFFVYWVTGNMVWFFLPILFEQYMTVFWVGVLTSLTPLVPVLFDIPVGNLVQRAGEKIVIFTGFAVGVLPPILYLSAVPVAFVGGKLTEGVSKSMVWNGSWSVSMKSADEDSESEALSVFLLGMMMSAVIGPILGGFLIASYGFELPLMLWFGGSLMSLYIFYLYIGLEGKKGFFDSLDDLFHRNTYSNDWRHFRENWSGIKLPLALVFLSSILYTFSWIAVPLILEDMGASFATMGIVFGVAAIPGTFQFLFGRLGDKIGELKVTAVLAILAFPVLLSMGVVDSLVVLSVLYFFAMILITGMTPVVHAIFDRNIPDEVESEMVGFLELFKHTGQAVGPIMAGTVASIWSLSASFISASVVALILVTVIAFHYSRLNFL